jgi:hypothetical protein
LARNTNPQEAVTPKSVRGEGGYDCKLDSRFQNEVRRMTPEIAPKHMAQNTNPQEETNGERYVRHWHERERIRVARELREAREIWERRGWEQARAAGWG